ncbi:inner membrane transport permease YbhR [bacterium BMS3Bbin03]|nr:inner membrane transport permease YbhR [bacterium BMS3Bbin03]
MRQILAMMRKEFKQIFRDRSMVAIIFLIPVIQLFILANAITLDVMHIKLLVADLDNSRVSREMIQAFSHTKRFDIVGMTRNLDGIRRDFRSWRAQMVLIIPPKFGRNLERRLNPRIQFDVDGVDGNTAGVALGYARGILTQFGETILQNPGWRASLQGVHLISMEERMWYNPELDSRQFIIPGIVVVLLTLLPMMLSSMSLVKEKETGTLEQLIVTPMKKYELILGKLIPFLILSYVELTLVMVIAIFFFHIAMNGSYFLLGELSFVYLFTTLGLGIFISTVTSSQQQAMFLSWFISIFIILMSGFFIPIENMPDVLQKLTYLNPMRYFMYIVRDIFQKGSGLKYLLQDAIPMTAYGVFVLSVSVLKFRKRVE